MAAIEQTWSLEGKVAVVTGSGKPSAMASPSTLCLDRELTGRRARDWKVHGD